MAQTLVLAPRLRLVPLALEHVEHSVRLYADPEVMRHLTGRGRTREEAVEAHRALLAVAGRVPGLGVWVGFVGDELIGRWTLEPPHRDDHGPIAGQAELGYRVRREYWRQGFASEGARALLRHGFVDLGLSRIFAETMAVNVASRRTMEAVGLRYVRTFRLDFPDPLPGSELGEVEYAITREEWHARQVF
ncbi:GNAT family N-acetyltransferase [Sporichthya brevicatena]|uniref:GNAT family N-acetyltransferase n=1 Tax=Sporichthya brevicatena TaxID=171442 RepID=A0ABN1H8Q1_9ACTN